MSRGRRLEVTVDSLAFGGDGVGREAGGRVVFVAGAAPGDRVLAEIREAKKGFVRADLVQVLAPSAERVEPPCPLFVAGCGGCQWQHVTIAAQRRAKEEVARRALRHAGAAVAAIEAPAPDYRWRRRARLRWRDGTVGYAARRSHRLVDVAACPQMEEGLERALVACREALAGRAGEGTLHLLLGGRGDVHVVIEGEPAPRVGDRLVGVAAIAGVRDAAHHGEAAIDLADGSRPFRASADVFAQASATGNAELRRLVGAAAAAGGRVLELHAGSGNFTRDLAGEVTAIEEHPAAAALGRGNAPAATWHAGAAEQVLPALRRAGARFDLCVVDPPRTGLARPLLAELAALAPARLVYVSCDPPTLGRDAAALAPAYRLTAATPVDLMPQTYHVEVVAVLERVSAPGRSPG